MALRFVPLIAVILVGKAWAVQRPTSIAAPVTVVAGVPGAVSAPASPRAQIFKDPRYGVSFEVPAGWNLNRHDGEVSTFGLDARTSSAGSVMRAAASIAWNPFPQSTFSGAYVYFSVAPRMTEAECTREASAMSPRKVSSAEIAGMPFSHGYDEHGRICTESRDEIYTAVHRDSCYRFDLVINTFCGGDVSGVKDITDQQLEDVRQKLESILSTVKIERR